MNFDFFRISGNPFPLPQEVMEADAETILMHLSTAQLNRLAMFRYGTGGGRRRGKVVAMKNEASARVQWEHRGRQQH
jgi:hypothetical protein